MKSFRKATPAKSIMFAVSFDDARTAYLWIDHPQKANDGRYVSAVAGAQQEQGILPPGCIVNIKRVR